MSRRFPRHLERGEAAEFLIDEREQFIGGIRVALLHRAEDLSHVAHG